MDQRSSSGGGASPQPAADIVVRGRKDEVELRGQGEGVAVEVRVGAAPQESHHGSFSSMGRSTPLHLPTAMAANWLR